MYTICLIEDEKSLNNLISTYLKKEGYNVIQCYSGQEFFNISNKIDLWILDIMLGDDITGYDIIKNIRKDNNQVPIIFTSARDQEIDKIMGLELDADDYITKPYSPKELVLRVNKLIKRTYSKDFNKIQYENYDIDIRRRTVIDKNKDKEIILTTLEFDLLKLLLTEQNYSLERDIIIEKIWGSNYYGSDRAVDDLIRRLRKKMPRIKINTIYGFGYRLV